MVTTHEDTLHLSQAPAINGINPITTFGFIDRSIHSVRQNCLEKHQSCFQSKERRCSLWKHLDRAAAESLITHPAHSIFGDENMAIPTAVAAWDAITKPQLRFFRECHAAPQRGYQSAFVDNRVCRPDPAAEIGFEIFDRKHFRNEIQR